MNEDEEIYELGGLTEAEHASLSPEAKERHRARLEWRRREGIPLAYVSACPALTTEFDD
jgi:hypothetical protein